MKTGAGAALYANRRSKRGHRRIEDRDWAGVHQRTEGASSHLVDIPGRYIARTLAGYSYSRSASLSILREDVSVRCAERTPPANGCSSLRRRRFRVIDRLTGGDPHG